MNLGVIARAQIARDHQVAIVRRHLQIEDDLGRIRPVIHEPIGRLRLADAVKPGLAEILFMLRRDRARLRVSRVEESVAPPRDRREFHPLQAIVKRRARRDVVNQQFLHVAAMPRQAVDDAIAAVVGFEDGDRRCAVRIEQIGIDQHRRAEALRHAREIVPTPRRPRGAAPTLFQIHP